MAEDQTETSTETTETETPAGDVSKELADLRAERDRLSAHLNEVLGETKAAKAARRKAEEDAAKKAGDIEALERSWNEKLEGTTGELTAKLEAAHGMVNKLTAGAAASKLAAELALPGSASVLEALIANRVVAEIKDGDARIVVRDKSGKPSASTLEDLKAELIADPALAPLLVGSKANGGGPAGGDGSAGQNTVTRAVFDGMSQSQRAQFAKSGGKVKD